MGKSNFQRFGKVATGLKCIYASLLLLVLSIFGGGLAGGIAGGKAAAEGRQVDQNEIGPVILVIGAAILVSTGLSIYGQISCINVPEKVRATNFIYAAVALNVVGTVLNIGGQAKIVPPAAGQVGSLFQTAGWICFLIFLKRLAAFLHNDREIGRANFVLWGSICAWISFIVVMIGLLGVVAGGPGNANAGGAGLLGLAALAIGIFALVLFISYSNLVRGLRLDIEDRLSGRDMAG